MSEVTALTTTQNQFKANANIDVVQRVQQVPGMRQLFLLIGIAIAIAVGIWVFNWSQKPAYVVLFNNLSTKDSADIVTALQNTGVDYQLDPISGAISVQETKVQETRLKLASQGLPENSGFGLEMLHKEQSIGTSQFVEGARYQAALETELARTISALSPIKSARVHLAISKPSAFTNFREAGSASVLVELASGRHLTQEQVDAIVYLVASSIPELTTKHITVIDQSGALLTRNNKNAQFMLTSMQLDQQRQLEETYVDRVISLLQPFTGPGRVNAEVSIEMDFSSTEEAREAYSPDSKVRSEQIAESTMDTKSAIGVPGATSNQPPSSANTNGSTTPSTASRNATRNFELDRTISHTKKPSGQVTRISAAVLIDHIPVMQTANPTGEATIPAENTTGTQASENNTAATENTGEQASVTESKITYRALTETELLQVENLVKEAIGYIKERGDTISVMNAAFAPSDMTPIEAQPIWEKPEFRDYIRLGLGAVILLALVFGVIRPMMRNLLGESQSSQTVLEAVPFSSEDEFSDNHNEERLSEPNTPLADPYAERLNYAKTAVQQDPRRVAQVIKSWVDKDG